MVCPGDPTPLDTLNVDILLAIAGWRAGRRLHDALSCTERLEKLSVVLPRSAKLTDFDKYLQCLPQLPFVKSLVVDPVSSSLITYCPNISSLTLVGFPTRGPDLTLLPEELVYAAGLKSLRSLEVDMTFSSMWNEFVEMPNIESLTLVGQIHGRNRLNLYFMDSEMEERFPRLRSLTLVVTGKPDDRSLASKTFFSKKYIIATAQVFFRRNPGLKEFGLACVGHPGGSIYKPRLLSFWKATRPPGFRGFRTRRLQLQSVDTLNLGMLLHNAGLFKIKDFSVSRPVFGVEDL
ncbi:hypothetical protein BC567DRAFT_213571 [Phyllosticta citribraziliensis]